MNCNKFYRVPTIEGINNLKTLVFHQMPTIDSANDLKTLIDL